MYASMDGVRTSFMQWLMRAEVQRTSSQMERYLNPGANTTTSWEGDLGTSRPAVGGGTSVLQPGMGVRVPLLRSSNQDGAATAARALTRRHAGNAGSWKAHPAR